MDFEKLAKQYFDEVRKNEFSRLRAWEFIYAYTRVDDLGVLVDEDHIEKTALHLGLYLAQWGMFRGSGKLIDQNLNYFIWMCKFFLKKIPGNFPDFYKHSFSDFTNDDFCKEFDEVISFIRAEELMMNPSDTLVSKILLGIWGHVPALDSKFKKTCQTILKEEDISVGLTSDFMKYIYEYCQKNEIDRIKAGFICEKDLKNLEYPTAKKLDMIFWLNSS